MTVLEFDGLTAAVTGGGSGIGQATARFLVERGANVACLDLDPSGAPEKTLGLTADVTDDESVAAAMDRVAQEYGGIDILVNNAGIGAIGTVETNPMDEWFKVFIVNTCSIAATAGLPQRALYSATKGAVYSLTLAMAADQVGEGIRVNAVCPGTADTPWVRRLLNAAPDPEAELAALKARQPMGRLVSADEVAASIAYLASPLAASTTGTILAVDGGMQGLRLRPKPAS